MRLGRLLVEDSLHLDAELELGIRQLIDPAQEPALRLSHLAILKRALDDERFEVASRAAIRNKEIWATVVPGRTGMDLHQQTEAAQ